MKAMFIGGIKSGKSLQAETFTLSLHKHPFYLATTQFIDDEMQERILVHQQRREKQFTTVESPLELYETLKACDTPVLVECISMWINNMLFHHHTKEQILEHMTQVLSLPNDIVFVLNDVGSGIIPDNALAREYVDISGITSQLIANACDEVYHCIAGIATKIK